ncbi:MAG: hypothetical protein K8J31_30990 [Anaerolineae bacterium]|nr:hypothetical protein [Anaerolineae bacterium]
MSSHTSHFLPATAVTSGKHHFFGYYDKFPWNKSGRYLLALESDFMERAPEAGDAVVIGLIDTAQGNQWMPLDETTAWNWQQSCMLHWLPSEPESTIIYNKRIGDRYVSMVRNIHSGETRTLPRPVYAISHDGKFSISGNFSRLHHTRPGYGYAGVPDPNFDVAHPDDDGLYWMDLETGNNQLIITLDQMSQFKPREAMDQGKHWFNHFVVNPANNRFTFLHRWEREGGGWFTRLFTANPDGSDIHLMADDNFVSHYDWYVADKVVAWAHHHDLGTHYLLYTDHTDQVEIVGEGLFSTDGHCSYSPDRQWMLTDTYPDAEHNRTLMLYHLATQTRIDIGKFYAPPELQGPIRCDLHPRWRRDGKQVCIDSAHEGQRQVYVLDVHEIIDSYA